MQSKELQSLTQIYFLMNRKKKLSVSIHTIGEDVRCTDKTTYAEEHPKSIFIYKLFLSLIKYETEFSNKNETIMKSKHFARRTFVCLQDL